MSPLLTSTAVAILWVHGLIHLMGAVVYMRLGSIEGLPYKTVLAGRWDVGGAGAAAFGLLWAVAAAGFVVAGAGLAAGADWWRPMTLVSAARSLVIALIDWPVAFVAVGVDLVVIVLAVASALPVLHG
jgi:hypothetical protein